MKLDLTDNIYNKYQGILQIEEIHKDKTIVRHAPNIITYDARTMMTHLLAGDNLTNKFVKYLHVGSDNTAPTRNDSDLGTTTTTVLVTYQFPDVDRVVFEGIIPNDSPANGTTLREAGLFNSDSQMFSRQVYGDIVKTNAIQLKYIWTIIFT